MFKINDLETEVLQLLILSWICFNNVSHPNKKEQETRIQVLEYLNSLSKDKSKCDKKKLQLKLVFMISESKSKKQILREIEKYKLFYNAKNKIFNKPFSLKTTIKDYYNYQQYLERFDFFYRRNQTVKTKTNMEIKIKAIKSLEILRYVCAKLIKEDKE